MSNIADQPPAGSVAKVPEVAPSRKPRLERVASLKPCEMPQSLGDGSIRYQMCYVTATGKQVYKDCTKAVYQKITAGTPPLDFRKKSDFVLTIDVVKNLVTSIVEQAKPDTMPGFTREDEKKAESNAIIFKLYPDTSVMLTSVPERVSEATIQQIQDAIEATEETILPGMKLASYTVLEKREVVGATEIHVDPMPR